MRKFSKIASSANCFEDLSDKRIKSVFKLLIKQTNSEGLHPTINEYALTGFPILSKIINNEERIATFRGTFFERLEIYGCVDFSDDFRKVSVHLSCQKHSNTRC